MAYPVHGGDYWVVNANRCPDTHPIAYPQVMLESFYELTSEQKANWRPGQANLVWANGDTFGDTLHADFVNGWPTHILQQAIDKKMEAFTDPVERIFGQQDGSAQYRAAQQCLMEVSMKSLSMLTWPGRHSRGGGWSHHSPEAAPRIQPSVG